jgi:chromosome segregation ATPase
MTDATKTPSNVCEHGNLRRKCEHCDNIRLEEELSQAHVTIAMMQNGWNGTKEQLQRITDRRHEQEATIAELRLALGAHRGTLTEEDDRLYFVRLEKQIAELCERLKASEFTADCQSKNAQQQADMKVAALERTESAERDCRAMADLLYRNGVQSPSPDERDAMWMIVNRWREPVAAMKEPKP